MDISAARQSPDLERHVLLWLEEMPPSIHNVLVMRFILMTSQDSGDFALTVQESFEHFIRFLSEPDFALRRLARILTVRSIFGFILEQDDEFFSACTADSTEKKLLSLDAAQILRARKSWRDLCRHQLSNEQLVAWLQAQPG